MIVVRRLALVALALVCAAVAPAAAQKHGAAKAPEAGAPAQGGEHAAPAAGGGTVDIITPHITDSHHIEFPYWKPPFVTEVELPTGWVVHAGSVTLDLSPTKHVVMLLLASTLMAVLLIYSARTQARQHETHGHAKGLAGAIEGVILYMRDEVILPNVGPHGNGFVPYLLTIFFFILGANLLGLFPYLSTATGNISVTAALALMTFLVIEISGMRALGKGYINTIIFWPHDMSLAMRIPMSLIISPIELIGKFARPFALAIRLFANMTAGHIVVLAFIGMIFLFASVASLAPFVMAIGIMLLELAVGFIQAFVFTLLASVFIGQVRVAHH